MRSRKNSKKFPEIKVSGNKWKWAHNNPKLMGQSKSSLEREVYSHTGQTQKKKKIETFHKNNWTLHLQEDKEQQLRPPRVSRRKEITKISAELNSIETRSTK